MLLVALLLACDTTILCQDLRTESAGNLVQPFDVAVDPVRRRAFVSAHASPQVAVVDIDARAFVDRVQYGAVPLDVPRVAVDGEGVLYVASHAEPRVLVANVDTGVRAWVDTGYQGVRAPVGLPTGFAALATADGDSDVVVFDGAGRVVSRTPAGDGSALFAADGGTSLVLLRDGGELERLALPGLETAERCSAGIVASSGASLDDGTLVLASATEVAIVACGSPPTVITAGVDNQDVVSLGDRAVVFDRHGSGAGADPNLGMARIFDATGTVGGPFVTAKNTGFAGADPQTGSAWANSEGTAEVVRLDASTGALDAVRLGQQVDGIAVDPRPGRVGGLVLTGRLSSRVWRLDEVESGAVPPSAYAETFWPYSPTIDPGRDRLYLLRQADMVVERRDPDSLALEAEHDLGLGPNTSLYFGTLVPNHSRDTLLISHPGADLLVELSHEGRVLASVALGGPALTDDDHLGELQLVVAADGAVIVLRSGDGRLQRVDLDRGVEAQVHVGDAFAAAVDIARVDDASGLLYVGGRAFHLDDLTEDEASARDVARMVGPDPGRPGGWIAVRADERALVRLHPDGSVTGEVPFAERERKAGRFELDADAGRVVMVRSQAARACVVPISSFDR